VASLAALSVVQGDLLYGSGTDALARLAKNTTATRYLANTGTTNNPAWAQIDLTNGVTGLLPIANTTTGTSGAAVPVLNGGATTWAAGAAFGGDLTSSGRVTGADVEASASAVDNVSGGVVRVTSTNGNAGARNWMAGASVNAYGDLVIRVSNAKGGNPATTANGTDVLSLALGTVDVTGLLRCDSFRIDQTPTAATPVPTHTFTISLNGTTYRIPCVV
jgi:hypothetical protein